MARIWNVAHRGASADAPENTVAAARLAIEQGADVVEADVRLTADGVAVLMHDADVDRTTDGTGPLRALSLEQVKALDAGRGERVPTVDELLAATGGAVRVNLDIKEAGAAEAALAAVRQAGQLGCVTFISFLPEVWDWVAEHSPESPVVHLVDSAKALAGLAMVDGGSRAVAAGVGVPSDLVTAGVVERMHRLGAGVFAWTVDDQSEMRRLIELGVNGVVTNRPAALSEVLHQLHLTNR
jgi:glycerophosphoryl diester phosphodiesterase